MATEQLFSWLIFNGITPHVVWMGCVTVLLLMLSALVSGSETSFFSLSHRDIQEMKEAESASTATALRSGSQTTSQKGFSRGSDGAFSS